MLFANESLKGYQLACVDGEIGSVRDVYFDDQHWAVRYLVAETGKWLAGRQVLISPYALLDVIKADEDIAVSLTKKQVEDSPSLNTDQPVSRQFETAYYDYYAWPMYWTGLYPWGVSAYPYLDGPYPRTANQRVSGGQLNEGGKAWDAHLRSARDMVGHHIEATDGEIGHVVDLLIDDQTWAVRYLVVSTRNWWPGKHVLISPSWISRVSWSESKVFVKLSQETIGQSPEFTDLSALNRDYELKLHGHYGRAGYWEEHQRPVASSH
jgi:uncharacterized protein YrrD